MMFWYLLHLYTGMALTSLYICGVLLVPSLITGTKLGHK